MVADGAKSHINQSAVDSPLSGLRVRSMKNIVFVATVIAFLTAPVFGAEMRLQRTIVVNGDGEVLAKLDQARITASVVTQAVTAEAAAQGNAAAMTRVMAALSM